MDRVPNRMTDRAAARTTDRAPTRWWSAWSRILGLLACVGMLAGCGPAEGAGDGDEAGAGVATETDPETEQRELRVCADPNNLPFSNEREEGFENELADLIASELDAEVRYTWWAQRRGFIRNTLRAGECDLVMGIPSSFELALPTRPYYRSTYVFVYPEEGGFDIESMDDPVLEELEIGVHVIGDDYANPPPAHALADRGIVENVHGYSIYGDYSRENPPARLIEAVAEGEIDVAIVWGPFGGYFAPQQDRDLALEPVSPEIDPPYLPFVFDIAMGVRRADTVFRNELDSILERNEAEIENILDRYAVPRVGLRGSPAAGEAEEGR